MPYEKTGREPPLFSLVVGEDVDEDVGKSKNDDVDGEEQVEEEGSDIFQTLSIKNKLNFVNCG